MDRHGQVVAKAHKLKKGPSTDKLLKRLESNEKTLLEVGTCRLKVSGQIKPSLTMLF